MCGGRRRGVVGQCEAARVAGPGGWADCGDLGVGRSTQARADSRVAVRVEGDAVRGVDERRVVDGLVQGAARSVHGVNTYGEVAGWDGRRDRPGAVDMVATGGER